MHYRKFGKIDWKVSALGFGIMRMPLLDNVSGELDEEESIRMIREGINGGINYIDTAYSYHKGKSEELVAKALEDGYRNKVKIATKLPSWLIKNKSDLDKYFNEQMERLHCQSIDFYLLHALNEKNWQRLQDMDIFAWIKEKKEKGLIKHIGFSFHDELPLFKKIIDSYDKWDFCQIQYNFMDKDYQAGEEGVKYAASKGLGIVVMEPLKGGHLAYKYPDSVKKIWDKATDSLGPIERAFAWLWDQESISVVLSGMSAMEHVVDNTEIADRWDINRLKENDRKLYDEAAAAYRALSPVPCTTCGICMPCPSGVDIPRNFELYNDAVMYGSYDQCREIYKVWFPLETHADRCTECGECIRKCPQIINIPEELKKVEKKLGD
jgi:predicted aldo/keto reductase-like oxidoreductase